MWRKKLHENPRRLALAAIAKETQATTPSIAAGLPHLDPARSEKLILETLPPMSPERNPKIQALDALPPLSPENCPRFKLSSTPNETYGTITRVFNQDTFDAALAMPSAVLGIASGKPTQAIDADVLEKLKSNAASPANLDPVPAARVAVLNMASEKNPGGGWLNGAAAQEEALCFRSTLAASLDRKMYPIQPRAGLYTRDVVVFRESAANDHKLMVPDTPMENLPVVTALTVAGIRRPHVKSEGEETQAVVKEEEDAKTKGKKKAKTPKGPLVFADPAARQLTKDKMRLCLRMAAAKGHTMLVLGAIGCGAFRNPPREVAQCWREVLSESEFAGGWFKEIWFGVLDRRNEGNFEIFKEEFDGKLCGEVHASPPPLEEASDS